MSAFFERIEKKYTLSYEQYQLLKEIIEQRLFEDEHGESTILNIYFDTDNYDIISHSITHPIYKDKVRLRSYNVPNLDSLVFLEIKRKYDNVISKRRIDMNLKECYKCINDINLLENQCQIAKEIAYYFKKFKLSPKMFISYRRKAYNTDDRRLRITFDNNIIARENDLEIEKGPYGKNLLDEDKYIMEIKTLKSIPIWLVNILSKLEIKPCNFSKYGEAYKELVLKRNKIKNVVKNRRI